MKIFCSGGDYIYDTAAAGGEPSVFLAGPTLRAENRGKFEDWRKTAAQLFRDKNFDGALYVPDPMGDFAKQVDWEVWHLERAAAILFWIPRRLDVLPGFTTNIEFGEYLRSGKIVLGCPPDAKKVRYLIYRAKKYKVPVLDNLPGAVGAAIDLARQKVLTT